MPPENDDAHSQIEKLEQRFAENPQGRVFALLADAYRKAGDLDQAEELILEGLDNHPDYLSAYIVLGRINLDRERFAEAREQFTKVLELDPHNLIALKALGDLSVQTHRLEEARSWYEQMLQVDQYSEEAQAALESLDELAGGGGAPADAAATGEVASGEEKEFTSSNWPDAASGETGPGAAVSPAEAPDSLQLEGAGTPQGGGAEVDLSDLDKWTPGLLGEGEQKEEIELDWGDEESGVVTETMAELYAEQGLYEDALKVYRELAEVRPYDEKIQARIRELSQLVEEGGPVIAGSDEVGPLPDSDEVPEPAIDLEESEVWAAAPPEPPLDLEVEAPAGTELEDPDPWAGLDVGPAVGSSAEVEPVPESEETAEPPIGLEETEVWAAAPPEAPLDLEVEAPAGTELEGLDPFAGLDVGPAVGSSDEVEPVAELEETPEPAIGLEESVVEAVATPEGPFEFEVEAPAGTELEELDAFAGSFDALIRASQTGVAPEPDAAPIIRLEPSIPSEDEAEPVSVSSAEEATPAPEYAAVVSEEPAILTPADEDLGVSAEAEPVPLEQPVAAAAEPEAAQAFVSETIETYLTRLLQYDPEARAAGPQVAGGSAAGSGQAARPPGADTGASPEARDSSGSSDSAEKPSEDLAQFQAWLRSLKR